MNLDAYYRLLESLDANKKRLAFEVDEDSSRVSPLAIAVGILALIGLFALITHLETLL